MEIGQEIKQLKFRNEYHKSIVNVIFTSNWLLEKMRIMLDREDITHQQYNILRILKGSASPLSTLQIRERMLDRMSDTSRIVERLIKKGLADKKLCSYDKRLVDITLTGKGFELLERLEGMNDEIDAIVHGLSTEEAVALNNLLDKLREND